MKLSRYSLISMLLETINSPFSKAVDFELARFFLENRNRLSELSIYDVENECFVSKSSIRRFCEKLGFDNFSDLKKELEIPYNAVEFEDELKCEPYINQHFDLIQKSIDFIQKNEIIHEQCEELAESLSENKNKLFIVSNASVHFMSDFQQQFLFFGYIIKIIKVDPINVIRNLYREDDTVIVVISISGEFANIICEKLQEFQCPKYLITSKEFKKEEMFDQVINMSNNNYICPTEVVIYRKYTLLSVLDLVYYYFVSIIRKVR